MAAGSVIAARVGAAFTTVTYAEAVDVALCWGWIDGQKGAVDDCGTRGGTVKGMRARVSFSLSSPERLASGSRSPPEEASPPSQ
jgi:hypothetical protein